MQCVEVKEVISTEEMLAKIDKINHELRDSEIKVNLKKTLVASLDAEALYPSLDVEKCSKMCADYVIQSGLKIEGFDDTWASIYLTLTHEQSKINKLKLNDVVPVRRHT